MYYLLYAENSDGGNPVDAVSVRHFNLRASARAAMMKNADDAIKEYINRKQDDDHYTEITEDSVYIRDGYDTFSWGIHEVKPEDSSNTEGAKDDRIYRTIRTAAIMVENGMRFETVVRLNDELHQTIQKYLSGELKQSRDKSESITVVFPTGFQMDIKCCAGSKNTSWTEACLFDSDGRERDYSEPRGSFCGTWDLDFCDESGTNMNRKFYRVIILAPDDPVPEKSN